MIWPHREEERGSAGVWLLALCGVLALACVAGVLVGAAIVSRHRAGAAADLAALAAAGRVLDGEAAACATAADVSAAMGARVRSCALTGEIASVTVVVDVRLGRFGVSQAEAHARAGPAGTASTPAATGAP